MDDGGTIMELSDSATPGTAPGPPVSGTQHIRTDTEQDEQTGTYLHQYRYALTTLQEQGEYGGYAAVDDPATPALVRHATVRVIDDSETPGATPDSPIAGLVFSGTTTNRDPKSGRWVHDFRYAPLNSVDAMAAGGYLAVTDPASPPLNRRATLRIVTTSEAAGAAPSTPVAGLVHVGTDTTRDPETGGWEHTYRYSPLTTLEEATAEESQDIIDPEGIEDGATILVIDSSDAAGSPPTPTDATLKYIGVRNKQRPDGTWGHLFTYSRQSSKDRIEQGGTSARFDPTEGPSSQTTAVSTVADTDTAIDLAAAAFAAASGADFAGVEVSKRNDLVAVTTTRLRDDDLLQTPGRWHFTTEYEEVKALSIAGFGTDAVYVRVASLPGPLIGGPGGYTEARLVHRSVLRTRGMFMLHRRIRCEDAAALTAAIGDRMAMKGQVNDDVFLDLKQYSVMYGGPRVTVNRKLPFPKLAEIDDVFEYDSLLHQDESQINVGPTTTASASTLINLLGDVQADTYFGSWWIMLWPTTAGDGGRDDYSREREMEMLRQRVRQLEKLVKRLEEDRPFAAAAQDDGTLVYVALSKTGGSDGTTTSAPSYTYSGTVAGNVTTGLTPAARLFGVGRFVDATAGIGYFTSGTLTLALAFEKRRQTGC